MTISTPHELLGALQAGQLDRLVGTPETDWLEFKGEPYRLEATKDKWELAKDVAALANHQGGRIVIGVQANRQPHETVDVATAVRPVSFTLLDPVQYQDLIRERIYPPIRDVQLAWHSSDPAAQKGVFVITVHPQAAGAGPFMVNRTLDEDGRATTQAFAIPRREDGVTVSQLVSQIHRLINRGLHGEQAEQLMHLPYAGDARSRLMDSSISLRIGRAGETGLSTFCRRFLPLALN
jgi:schlafen family protein